MYKLIGRNWLGSVLVRVLRGHVLANAILDGVLAGTFNGRMSRKLLIVVDEARAGMRGTNAWQHSEKLKTILNPELREINEKHGLQRAEHNAMRWLVFSNHWDALPIERNDRRWNVVENPTTRQHTAYYDWLYEQLYRDELSRLIVVAIPIAYSMIVDRCASRYCEICPWRTHRLSRLAAQRFDRVEDRCEYFFATNHSTSHFIVSTAVCDGRRRDRGRIRRK